MMLLDFFIANQWDCEKRRTNVVENLIRCLNQILTIVFQSHLTNQESKLIVNYSTYSMYWWFFFTEKSNSFAFSSLKLNKCLILTESSKKKNPVQLLLKEIRILWNFPKIDSQLGKSFQGSNFRKRSLVSHVFIQRSTLRSQLFWVKIHKRHAYFYALAFSLGL